MFNGTGGFESLTHEETDKLEESLVRHGLTAHVSLTALNLDAAVRDLLVAELIVTRTLSLQMLVKGMNVLGLGELLRKHPCVVESVFVSVHDATIDAELLLQKITIADGEEKDTDEKKKAWEWFLRFVCESETTKDADGESFLRKLLVFMTGQPILDPADKIVVKFLNPAKKLIEADACFNKVFLPVTHKTFEEFKKSCTTSLCYGGVGYGRF